MRKRNAHFPHRTLRPIENGPAFGRSFRFVLIAVLSAGPVTACSSAPPASDPPSGSGSTTGGASTGGNYTFDPVTTTTGGSSDGTGLGGMYDASNLAAKLGSVLTPTALDACKSNSTAFIRGKNICSNVKLETGWCDFSSIISKFNALGTVNLKNDAAGITSNQNPDAFFNAVKDKNWLPDQCGTVDAGNGVRYPVVFLYRAPTGSTGFQIMPVCLTLPTDAPSQFKDLANCEI